MVLANPSKNLEFKLYQVMLVSGSVAALAVFADHITKTWIVKSLKIGESHIVLPNVLCWTHVQNFRGAYGQFGDNPRLLIVLSLMVLVVFTYAFRRSLRSTRSSQLAMGLIFGGAAGNILDRLYNGYVVDFISVRPLPVFENFNVADFCICVGAITILITSFAATLNKSAISSK